MAYVDIKALVTSFAKVTQWLAMSKRMLLIVSPFLAIVAVLVWLAIVSIDILTAGRAYVEGESLWSKNQKEAVFHLLRFAETKSESDFRSYRKAIMVPLGFQKARFELEKSAPDYSAVRAGFIEGGTHPDDIPGVISLYQRFHRVSYMKSVLDIWRTGDDFLARLDAAAEELHAFHRSGRVDPSGLGLILNRIIQVNEELRPWQNRFSTTLGEATRWIRSTLFLVIVTVAGTLVPIGIFLTQRMVSRVDRAERELKELKLGQEYAVKLAYHASHDQLTNLVNRPEFENRLRLALHTATNQGRQHVVMYLDLDQFKIVNDTCGHAAGDQLLRRGEMEWVSRLQRALQEGRFVLHAQEIHSIGDQSPRSNHYELLVRMLDEHDKVVPPMAFIPAAERYNMMPLIDQWVIQDAFAKINSLGSKGE